MDVLPVLEELDKTLPDQQKEEIRKKLAQYLNGLLLHDFHTLVQLLYRVDVSEKKLKTALKENPQQNAGELIADLMIQRQQEKKATREAFRFSSGASDEERW